MLISNTAFWMLLKLINKQLPRLFNNKQLNFIILLIIKDNNFNLKRLNLFKIKTSHCPYLIIIKNKNNKIWVVLTDTHTGMLPGIPGSAMCVQNFDDSLNSAIRITYRISLRSSSLREPRYPSLKVVFIYIFLGYINNIKHPFGFRNILVQKSFFVV